ncbi:MAG: hypothetical protein WBA38_04160 [Gordonia sp. (in: high G+C Gram-positive bacteria)]
MTSLRDWLTDQIAEAVRPLAHAITADVLQHLRIDITVRLSLDPQ